MPTNPGAQIEVATPIQKAELLLNEAACLLIEAGCDVGVAMQDAIGVGWLRMKGARVFIETIETETRIRIELIETSPA